MIAGGGQCDRRRAGGDDVSRNSCGGANRGLCNRKSVCECIEGWTGPHCLAAAGFDPIEWDPPDKISDVGFIPPEMFPQVLVGGLIIIAVILLISVFYRRRMQGWTPIPDVATKYVN